ncbi:MAG: hypothetical protein OXU45_08485 [Candidatus Melainabacteria bacterium]|nr:hypothetical protein [Candidatus Melainabacteria bacterium]
MEERRKLLAKALMDLSKLVAAGVSINQFVNPGQHDWFSSLVMFGGIIYLGFMAWLIMPCTKEK